MARKKRQTKGAEHRQFLNRNRHHYDGLLEYQGYGCAICGRSPSVNRRLDLDHQHRPPMVCRGLLCVRCNQAIPSWMDSDWCRRAAEYLSDPPFGAYLKTLEETII